MPERHPREDPQSPTATLPAERILLLAAPRGEGDEVVESPLEALRGADLAIAEANDLDGLASEIHRGAGAVFVAAGELPREQLERLRDALDERPGFDDLPFFVIAGPGDSGERPDPGRRQALEALSDHHNVTLFESEPTGHALLAAARGALRERQRQIYVRQLLGRIEEAEEREDRLLAALGHELRNPLGVIATALTVMRRIEGDDSPTARHRQMIERQVASLTRRIDELLTGDLEPAHELGREWPPASLARREPPAALPDLPPVLVVEDDDDGRTALAELLTLWGYRVATAADGETGLEQARKVEPAIALLDIGLPGIDGYEVARQIRRDLGGGVTLIAMTGYGQAEDRRRAITAGFDRHLVKPVDSRRLAELLAERSHSGAA